MPVEVAARARWEMAAIHKRNRNYQAALPLWWELETEESHVELAKYYEHKARDFPAALQAARAASGFPVNGHHAAHLRRLQRLEKRV